MSEREPALSATVAVLGIVLGASIALALVPSWSPALASSLTRDGKAVWFVTRSSGLVAFGLLWLSVLLGLWLTNRFARVWPSGPVAFALHEHASLLGLAFAALHALVLIFDPHVGGTLVELFVPFASPRGRLWMGFGQTAFWLSIVVTSSFYVRKRLGQWAWRLLHFASFALFLLALLHGAWGGTESKDPWMVAGYGVAGGSVAFLTIYRVLAARFGVKTAPRRAAPAR